MSYNYNTQCTTIYHETFYCIQYVNGSLTMYYTAAMMGEHCFIQYYHEICPSGPPQPAGSGPRPAQHPLLLLLPCCKPVSKAVI